MEKIDLITTRLFEEGDTNLVLSTWLKGLYYGESFFSEIPKNIFMEFYHQHLERLLKEKRVVILVACLKDTPDVVLGYAVYSATKPGVLHWVYVKTAWRKLGIARSLIPNPPVAATHLTKTGRTLLKEKFPEAVFNPFLI